MDEQGTNHLLEFNVNYSCIHLKLYMYGNVDVNRKKTEAKSQYSHSLQLNHRIYHLCRYYRVFGNMKHRIV